MDYVPMNVWSLLYVVLVIYASTSNVGGLCSADTELLSGTKRWTFIAENKRKPQFTSIIAASSGAMKADEVAKKALDGVKSASFIIPCNFEESYCPLRLLVNPLRDRAWWHLLRWLLLVLQLCASNGIGMEVLRSGVSKKTVRFKSPP